MKKIMKFLWMLGIILLSVLFILFLFTDDNKKNMSIIDNINKTKSITVGYIPYNNSFIVDPNTWEYSGIFYEVMEEVWNRLDLEIDYKYELAWSDMITAIDLNKIDLMVTGIWPTDARSKFVEYIEPLYYSPVFAYTQYTNTKFDDNLDNINNKNIRIGVIDWEVTTHIANNDFPNAQTYSSSQLTNIDQLMLDIVWNKTDVTFLESSVANKYMEINPWNIKQIESINPIRNFANSMIVKKWETELKSTIDNIILELKEEGFISEVISKYSQNEEILINN